MHKYACFAFRFVQSGHLTCFFLILRVDNFSLLQGAPLKSTPETRSLAFLFHLQPCRSQGCSLRPRMQGNGKFLPFWLTFPIIGAPGSGSPHLTELVRNPHGSRKKCPWGPPNKFGGPSTVRKIVRNLTLALSTGGLQLI